MKPLKKNHILFILFITVLLTSSFFADFPRDVSPQLDVYDQVKSIIDLGVMNVDANGNFNGTNIVNRYDLASTLFVLRDSILGSGVFKETAALSGRVGTLEQTANNMKTSIDTLRRRIDVLEVSLSTSELDAMERRLLSMKDEVMVQMQEIESKTSFISGYSDFLVAVEQELQNIYDDVKQQESRLVANEANVGRLLEYLRKYEKLDTWMGIVDENQKKSENTDSRIFGELDAIDKRVTDLEAMGDKLNTIQREILNMKPTVENAAMVPAMNARIEEMDLRLVNVENMNSKVIQLQQDVDYMKIEHDRLKNELEETKKQFWYAMGLSVAGCLIGAGAIFYAYSISGSIQQ